MKKWWLVVGGLCHSIFAILYGIDGNFIAMHIWGSVGCALLYMAASNSNK